MCWATVATAEQIRVPQTGPVAFIAQLANGWTYVPNDANSGALVAPDTSSAISLMVELNDPTTAAMSDDQLANSLLLQMNAPAFTQKQPGTFGGVSAYAYSSRMTNSNNVTMNIQMFVIKPVGQYVAIAAIMSELQLNDAQSYSLEAMKKGVTIQQNPEVAVDRVGQTADIEALMREVVPADAVCQRTAISHFCEYMPEGDAVFTIKLTVYTHGQVEFRIIYPDTRAVDIPNDTRLPLPARRFKPDAYATDISRALDAMKSILEQDRYGFDEAQIHQCLQLSLPETGILTNTPSKTSTPLPPRVTDSPPNQFQVANKDWTLSCRKGPEIYDAFFHKGNGYIGIHVDVQATPRPPSNRF